MRRTGRQYFSFLSFVGRIFDTRQDSSALSCQNAKPMVRKYSAILWPARLRMSTGRLRTPGRAKGEARRSIGVRSCHQSQSLFHRAENLGKELPGNQTRGQGIERFCGADGRNNVTVDPTFLEGKSKRQLKTHPNTSILRRQEFHLGVAVSLPS